MSRSGGGSPASLRSSKNSLRRRSSPPASSPKKSEYNNQLYKTELCRSFADSGYCRYGMKCRFAHGQEDLRPVQRHKKYKTEICKNFAAGTCPYASRCRFIHQDDPEDLVSRARSRSGSKSQDAPSSLESLSSSPTESEPSLFSPSGTRATRTQSWNPGSRPLTRSPTPSSSRLAMTPPSESRRVFPHRRDRSASVISSKISSPGRLSPPLFPEDRMSASLPTSPAIKSYRPSPLKSIYGFAPSPSLKSAASLDEGLGSSNIGASLGSPLPLYVPPMDEQPADDSEDMSAVPSVSSSTEPSDQHDFAGEFGYSSPLVVQGVFDEEKIASLPGEQAALSNFEREQRERKRKAGKDLSPAPSSNISRSESQSGSPARRSLLGDNGSGPGWSRYEKLLVLPPPLMAITPISPISPVSPTPEWADSGYKVTPDSSSPDSPSERAHDQELEQRLMQRLNAAKWSDDSNMPLPASSPVAIPVPAASPSLHSSPSMRGVAAKPSESAPSSQAAKTPVTSSPMGTKSRSGSRVLALDGLGPSSLASPLVSPMVPSPSLRPSSIPSIVPPQPAPLSSPMPLSQARADPQPVAQSVAQPVAQPPPVAIPDESASVEIDMSTLNLKSPQSNEVVKRLPVFAFLLDEDD